MMVTTPVEPPDNVLAVFLAIPSQPVISDVNLFGGIRRLWSPPLEVVGKPFCPRMMLAAGIGIELPVQPIGGKRAV